MFTIPLPPKNSKEKTLSGIFQNLFMAERPDGPDSGGRTFSGFSRSSCRIPAPCFTACRRKKARLSGNQLLLRLHGFQLQSPLAFRGNMQG